MSTTEGFDGWGVLEVMGHRVVAGRVREVAMFGAKMVQVDVPELEAGKDAWGHGVPAVPAFTQRYGGSAIFCFTETTEAVARKMAAERRTRPPEPVEYRGPSRQLAGVNDGGGSDDDSENDDVIDAEFDHQEIEP